MGKNVLHEKIASIEDGYGYAELPDLVVNRIMAVTEEYIESHYISKERLKAAIAKTKGKTNTDAAAIWNTGLESLRQELGLEKK